MYDYSLAEILIAVLIGVAAHVVLLFASFRWNVLFLLTAAFSILAMLSVADLPYVGLAKYARVYCTVITVFVGVVLLRQYRFGVAGNVLLFFVVVHAASAIWSDYPLLAISYKGLFSLAAISGLLIAQTISTKPQFTSGIHILFVAASAFTAILLWETLTNPASINRVDRLATFGLNPNRIGHLAAPFAIVSMYVALWDPIKRFRICAYAVSSALLFIVLYTGSRGALAEFALGTAIIAMPLLRRPVLAIVLGTIALFTVQGVVMLVDPDTAERFVTEFTLTGRMERWEIGFDALRESPILGVGWLWEDFGTGPVPLNMHSMYIQILAESGLLGISLLLLGLVVVASKALGHRRTLRHEPFNYAVLHLAIAFIVPALGHGMFESSNLAGASTNIVFMFLGIGLLDRLPIFQASMTPEYEEVPADEYQAEYAPLAPA